MEIILIQKKHGVRRNKQDIHSIDSLITLEVNALNIDIKVLLHLYEI